MSTTQGAGPGKRKKNPLLSYAAILNGYALNEQKPTFERIWRVQSSPAWSYILLHISMTLYLMCHYHTTMQFRNTVQSNLYISIALGLGGAMLLKRLCIYRGFKYAIIAIVPNSGQHVLVPRLTLYISVSRKFIPLPRADCRGQPRKKFGR